jgi:large subunit ribosomal protein L17
MRHLKKTVKLGRTGAHRDAMLANQVCNLIAESRIKTTISKAKATRSLAEKMVTLGKAGTLAARRQALAVIKQPEQVKKLFDEIAPKFAGRAGGYTRITKLGPRMSDASEMVILEWVEASAPVESEK